MISNSDIKGRLNLFRYGLVVVVIVTFLVSVLAPYAALSGVTSVGAEVPLGSIIMQALIFTVVVAVLAVGAYFAYKMLLERTVSGGQ